MEYYIYIITLISIWTILSQSYSLIIGYTGLATIYHIALFGIGTYTTALLATGGYGFFTAFFASGLLTMLFGFLIAFPTIKFKEGYLVIITLAFSELIRLGMINWTSLTRGPLGIPGIPRPEIFGIEFKYVEIVIFDLRLDLMFILCIIVCILTNIFLYRVIHSPYGKVLEAIREDEIAAKSIGKNIIKYKLQALSIGAFFAGIAGCLFAYFSNFVDPNLYKLPEMIMLILMVILGGLGSFSGPILGTIIIFVIPELLRFLPMNSDMVGAIRLILFGLILVLIIKLKPNGLMGRKSVGK